MTEQEIRKPTRPDETLRALPKAWKRYIKELEYYADLQEGRAQGFLEAINLAIKKEKA